MLRGNYSKKTYVSFFALCVSLLLFSPFFAKAYDGSYTYRSTVVGRGVEQFAGGYNRLTGEGSSFNAGESVYALSRVFNITDVQSFQIKHQLYRDGVYYNDYYSEHYQPNGRWWAETYAWNNLGNLPAGSYTLKTYSQKGNSGYEYHKEIYFKVVDSYNTHPVAPAPVNNYPSYNFNYVNTHTGTGVEEKGYYIYEIINQKEEFAENEPLYVVGRLAEIRGIEKFVMKYDLYKEGDYYQTLYSWEQKPNNSYWPYNYTWVNFGNLSEGDYVLQTSIGINGGSYTNLDYKTIRVYDYYYDNDKYCCCEECCCYYNGEFLPIK